MFYVNIKCFNDYLCINFPKQKKELAEDFRLIEETEWSNKNHNRHKLESAIVFFGIKAVIR
jgi:hypothetical protein